MKKAIIFGVTGQDGSYLAEILLEKGYEVFGVMRRTSTFNTGRIDHLVKDPHTKGLKFHLVFGDLADSSSINKIIRQVKPDEIYNLGAQSHVRVSFDIPEYTSDVVGLGALRILDAVKEINPKIKYYQASSSEMFGKVLETPQSEKTPFNPASPYGCAKVFAFNITKNYRESYGIFACNGILFNHESKRRGKTFVTKKITEGAVRIKYGKQECLYLGNLEAKRDWGHAKDYVEAQWLMLQHKSPDDYVIATGETRSVREFLYLAFKNVGIELVSNNKKGDKEELRDKRTGKVVVRIDPKYYRPCEVDLLLGNSSKARRVLKWKPKISFMELVAEMIEEDTKQLGLELYGEKGVHI